MSKLKKLITGLRLLLRQPSAINMLLEDDAHQKQLFLSHYAMPHGLPYVQLTNLVQVNEVQVHCSLLEGGSLPADYLLLAGLAKKQGGNYFEIGTWRGESVLNVAPFMQSCITLNLPATDIVQQGGPQNYASQMGFFSKPIANIRQVEANSLTYDFAALQQSFNLIFIDGDHHYDSVKSDTQNVFRHLITENTIVVWHDYGRSPEQPRWEVLRGILDGLPLEKQQHLYAVSHTLCAVYYPFGIQAKMQAFPQHPGALFRIRINQP